MEPKPISQILTTIPAIAACAEPGQGQPSKPGSSSNDRSRSDYAKKMLSATEAWKRNWLTKRLQMDRHHPTILALEEAVWTFCVGFVGNPSRGRRMVIFGNNGTGKSRVVRAVRKWVQERAMDMPLVNRDEGMGLPVCEYVNWPKQVDRMKAGDWDTLPYEECELLILDDVGAEHDPSKAGLAKLYLILERREWKWTIITTNFPPEFWEEKFERRISDRMFRNAGLVDMTKTPSYSVNT